MQPNSHHFKHSMYANKLYIIQYFIYFSTFIYFLPNGLIFMSTCHRMKQALHGVTNFSITTENIFQNYQNLKEQTLLYFPHLIFCHETFVLASYDLLGTNLEVNNPPEVSDDPSAVSYTHLLIQKN